MRSSNAYWRHRRHSREHAGAGSRARRYAAAEYRSHGYSSLTCLHGIPFGAIKTDFSSSAILGRHRATGLAPGRRTGHSRAGAFSHVARDVAVIVRALTVLDENLGISTPRREWSQSRGLSSYAGRAAPGVQGHFISRTARRRHRATTGPWIRPMAGLPLSAMPQGNCRVHIVHSFSSNRVCANSSYVTVCK
jgi:hypothetical protein